MNEAFYQFLQLALVLAVISCGISIMVCPLFGWKMDPFLILRPIARKLRVALSHLFRSLSKELKAGGKKVWQRANAPTSHPAIRALLYAGSVLLYLAGLVVILPVCIIGTSGKK